MKLCAFIGSSSKSLNVSNAIKHNLRREINCVVWEDGFFKLSRTTLETLVNRWHHRDLKLGFSAMRLSPPSFKELNDAVKRIVRHTDGRELDGAPSMNTAFSPNNPVIRLTPYHCNKVLRASAQRATRNLPFSRSRPLEPFFRP
jgi:hypothetical protein